MRNVFLVIQYLLQHLEQVSQAIDVAVVMDLAGEDVGKVNHSDLNFRWFLCLLSTGVQLFEVVPCAVVLLALMVALHAAFLVQRVHGREALFDVVVVLQNPFVLLQAPGAGLLIRSRRTPLVDEEQRAGIKVQLGLVLKPAKDALDLGDAGSDDISAKEVAIVEELT